MKLAAPPTRDRLTKPRIYLLRMAVFVILSGGLSAVGYVAWRYLPKSL